ncbi:MAG: hypothetical protein PHU71_05695 [Candidatus Gracilibacteria bacterium]|nr:hypothetical protein [Candidatus Gracilibacteria bacterium]
MPTEECRKVTTSPEQLELLDKARLSIESAELVAREGENPEHAKGYCLNAAKFYEQAGEHEVAAGIYNTIEEYAKAALCYQQLKDFGGAALMYEKAAQQMRELLKEQEATEDVHNESDSSRIKGRLGPDEIARLLERVMQEDTRGKIQDVLPAQS